MDLVYFAVLMVFVLLDIMAIFLRMPVVSVVCGCFGFLIGAVAVSMTADVPFSPYPQLFLMLVCLVCLVGRFGLLVDAFACAFVVGCWCGVCCGCYGLVCYGKEFLTWLV